MCAPKAAPAESVAAIIIGRMTDSTPVAIAGAAPLNHLGVIRISGADAANFIHNQLTQDFLLLPPQHARLAAFCSAKGRMQASFAALTDFLRDQPAEGLRLLGLAYPQLDAATLQAVFQDEAPNWSRPVMTEADIRQEIAIQIGSGTLKGVDAIPPSSLLVNLK